MRFGALYRLARVRRLAALAVLASLAAGCSTSKPGGEVVSPTPETVVGTVPKQAAATVPSQYQNGDPTAGRKIFLTAGCASCHTLKDAGTNGTVGPNLDDAQPDLATAIERLTKGGGAMPSFKDQLSDQQIANVAAYVVKATGGGS